MSKPPLVSVCIPSYNNEKFIASTIESILLQDFQDFEIIVCDDQSTDSTTSVVKSFTDNRIQLYINDKNLGITGNWNRAISLAQGKYIKLVCGDDILYPNCLQSQIDVLENDLEETISLVASVGCIINSSNKLILKRNGAFKTGIVPSRKAITKNYLSGTNVLGEPMTGMFRKSILYKGLQYNGSNPYMIDLDFWFKLLKHGNLYYINQTQAAFRISGKSISATINYKQPIMFQMFIRKNIRINNIHRIYLIPAYINSTIKGVLRNLFFLFVK